MSLLVHLLVCILDDDVVLLTLLPNPISVPTLEFSVLEPCSKLVDLDDLGASLWILCRVWTVDIFKHYFSQIHMLWVF